MTVGELKTALSQYSDNDVVAVGVPFWECNLTTDVQTEKVSDNLDALGSIMGLDSPAQSVVVLFDSEGGNPFSGSE